MAKVDLRLVLLQVERFGSLCYIFILTQDIIFCIGCYQNIFLNLQLLSLSFLGAENFSENN